MLSRHVTTIDRHTCTTDLVSVICLGIPRILLPHHTPERENLISFWKPLSHSYSYSSYLAFLWTIWRCSLFRSNISPVCAGGERVEISSVTMKMTMTMTTTTTMWNTSWPSPQVSPSMTQRRCAMLPDPLRSCLLLLITLPFFGDDGWWFGRPKLLSANIPFGKGVWESSFINNSTNARHGTHRNTYR